MQNVVAKQLITESLLCNYHHKPENIMQKLTLNQGYQRY